MNLVGSRRVVSGHDGIEQVWSVGLRGRDTREKRMIAISIDSADLIEPQLAVVGLMMTFGHERTRVIREAMAAVVRKDDSGWRIASSRVARISSTAARH